MSAGTVLDRSQPVFTPPQDFQTVLELHFIDVYLRTKGHSRQSLRKCGAGERRGLMTEASIYASCRLAEIEMRADFLRILHGNY